MTGGVVFGFVAAVLLVLSTHRVSSWVGRRLDDEHRNTVRLVGLSLGLLTLAYSAEDLRPRLGPWWAYGVTFGTLVLVVAVCFVVVLRRPAPELPKPESKWTQQV